MPSVTQTPQAEDDLTDLFTNLGRQSRAAAGRVRVAIDRAAKLLVRSPNLGRTRPDLRAELRSYPVAGKYIIYYRVTDEGIEIARVLHGARQVDASMFED